MLESIDERNKSSSLSYHYQIVKLKFNEQIVDKFEYALNNAFYNDLSKIYQNTISIEENIIDQRIYDLINKNISYQVVTEEGYAKYFVYQNFIIGLNKFIPLICLPCKSKKTIDFTQIKELLSKDLPFGLDDFFM